MGRFTLPRDLYHGKGSLEELKHLTGKRAILVVGGGSMKRFGFVDRAVEYLKEAGMEVRLYRILNISIQRSLIQRIFGLGTIHLDSTDKDLSCFDIVNIKNSESVMEMISEAVEAERLRNRVASREFMSDGMHENDAEEDGIHDSEEH